MAVIDKGVEGVREGPVGIGDIGGECGVPTDLTRRAGGVGASLGPGLSMYKSSMRFASCRREVDIVSARLKGNVVVWVDEGRALFLVWGGEIGLLN